MLESLHTAHAATHLSLVKFPQPLRTSQYIQQSHVQLQSQHNARCCCCSAQARAMSDKAILQHLRHAMGKCAIMVLQEQGEAAWLQQHPANSGCSVPSVPQSAHLQEAQQEQGRRGGHPLVNKGLSAGQQGPFMTPALASALGSMQPGSTSLNGTSSLTGNGCSGSCGGSYTPVWGRGPAFEMSAIWGMLFTWDNSRFMRLISLDLETGHELKVRHGPGFGRWLVDRLCLTPDQVDILKGLRDLVKQQHEHLPTTLQQASTQQQVLTQQQEMHGWASNIRSAGQVYEAQEQILQQQAAAVERFRTLAEFMGLVTLNTLTPAQLAVLHACSWPAICRIEPVLDVLDDS